MYTDLAGLKTYLGITVNTQDARLNQILSLSWGVIVSALGDFTQADREFTFKLCDISGLELNFNTVNITEIKEINGQTFTTPATDFMILDPMQSRIYVKNLWNYLEGVEKYFKVKVECGYDVPVPTDLTSLQLSVCSLFYNTSGGQQVKSYSLGPRSFTFADNSANEMTVMSVNNIIARYTPLVLI